VDATSPGSGALAAGRRCLPPAGGTGTSCYVAVSAAASPGCPCSSPAPRIHSACFSRKSEIAGPRTAPRREQQFLRYMKSRMYFTLPYVIHECQASGSETPSPGVELGHPVPEGYEYFDLALQVGGTSTEAVAFCNESRGTRIREWLRWRGPAVVVDYSPVLSSESTSRNTPATVRQQ
jgi:hypothetical protein